MRNMIQFQMSGDVAAGGLIPQASDALAGEASERGRTSVLVIDEAHLLDHAQLESIRMLTVM